jgi:Tfp pilus assembly PilM family ATPase
MSMIEDMEDAPQTVLRCRECSAPNLRQRNFCVKCGAPLWQSCLQCGSLCAVGEHYCGSCGANLEETAANQVEQVESEFRCVGELRSACRFEEAMARLVRMTKSEHPGLAEYIARAKQLILEVGAERDRRRAEAEENYELARERMAAFDVGGAAELLENVPPALRGRKMEEFRAEVMTRLEEITTLHEELRSAVRQNRLLDLPSKIERLLVLKPDHVYGREVAEKVQQRVVEAAEKQLAEHQYDQALRLLEQIAPHVRTQRAERLHRQVEELAWLAWDLRNAPVVDATLLAVAERLRRLAPRDERAGKLCAELQRRARLTASQGTPLPWARPPRQTPLGVPVEWLTGFRRIRRAESLEQPELVRAAGRFAVACGLALTGLKQAALPMNLLAADQRGVLSRVGQMVRSRGERSAWGIDLGPSGLKAVKLAWDEEKQQAVIEAAALIEHAKLLSHAANEAEERRLVGDTLKAFLDSQETKSAQVCVGMPGRLALSRPLELPPIDAAKVPKFVEFEARYQFPFPPEQLSWDFQLFDSLPPGPNGEAGPADKESRRALLIGVKRTATQHFLESFQRLGLRVDALQTDFVGLHNLLVFEHFGGEKPAAAPAAAPAAVAALDVGGDVTNIVVSSPYSLWHHVCGVAGQTFTRALVREFNLSLAQAEQRKRAPEAMGRLSDLFEVLRPVCEELPKETQEALAGYAQAQPDRPPRHMVGLGGGLALHGLLRFLRCGR